MIIVRYILFFVLILLSDNGYSQWIQQNLPSGSVVMLSVAAKGDHAAATGWSFGDSSVTAKGYYTSGNGSAWYDAQFPDSARTIVDIEKWGGYMYGSGARNNSSGSDEAANLIGRINAARKSKNYRRLSDLNTGLSGTQDLYRGAFFRSTNDGQSWQYYGQLPDSVNYMKKMAVTPAGTFVACASRTGGDRVIRSTDGGLTWNYSSPVIPNLILSDIAADCFGRICAAGYAGDSVSITGVLLSSNTSGEWTVKQIPGTASFSTVTALCNGVFFAAADSANSTEPHSLLYTSPDLKDWAKYPFDGRRKFISRIKFVFEPFSAAGIILADTMMDNGSAAMVLRTAPYPDYGKWIPAQYFPADSFYYLYDADLVNFNRVYLCGTQNGSGAILYNSAAALPVELTSFTAENTGDKVALRWSTASELNNRGFEIERKSSGGDFLTIAFISGAGTVQNATQYKFDDTPPFSGNYAYRLKQYDYDGSYKYSDILSPDYYSGSDKLFVSEIFPNPFSADATVRISIKEKSQIAVRLFSVAGEMLETIINSEYERGAYTIKINAKYLPEGVYFCEVRCGMLRLVRKASKIN